MIKHYSTPNWEIDLLGNWYIADKPTKCLKDVEVNIVQGFGSKSRLRYNYGDSGQQACPVKEDFQSCYEIWDLMQHCSHRVQHYVSGCVNLYSSGFKLMSSKILLLLTKIHGSGVISSSIYSVFSVHLQHCTGTQLGLHLIIIYSQRYVYSSMNL